MRKKHKNNKPVSSGRKAASKGKKTEYYPYRLVRNLYLGITVFCLIFFLVYDHFSHGVRSPYMTYLCLWPMLMGLIPSIILMLVKRLPAPDSLAANLYNAGVAAVTMSSCLRGVMDIAGNASVYQVWLMRAGMIMAACGAVLYLRQIIIKPRA